MHSSDPNFESVRLTLARILPFLEAQRELQQNVAMIEPIKVLKPNLYPTKLICVFQELVSQESNTSFLSKRQQGILGKLQVKNDDTSDFTRYQKMQKNFWPQQDSNLTILIDYLVVCGYFLVPTA